MKHIRRIRWTEILIGVVLIGFVLVQLGLAIVNLVQSIRQYPGRKIVGDLALIRQEKAQGLSAQVPAFGPDSVFTNAHLQFTRDRIDPDELSAYQFPDYLMKYALYDSSGKRALLDLQNWLFENKRPVPLFEDMFLPINPPSYKPRVCLGIISANRDGSPFSYLIQTVSALLNRMKFAQNHHHVYIHVFNVASPPSKNREANVISQFVPVTNLKDGSTSQSYTRRQQENLDYAEILKRMNSLPCGDIILIEDDALPRNNWVDSVMLAVRQMELYEHKDQWLTVKLFCARKPPLPDITNEGVNPYYFARWNAVAQLINKRHIMSLADYLIDIVEQSLNDSTVVIAKDENINTWRETHGLQGMCYEPVIFQHTGVISSIQERLPDRDSVEEWYMSSKQFPSESQPILFESVNWDPLLTR